MRTARTFPILRVLALLLAFAGCAHQAGKQAAEGAVEELAEPPAPAVSGDLAKQFVESVLVELSKPEQLQRLERVAQAASAGALHGVTAPSAGRRGVGLGGSGAGTGPVPPPVTGTAAGQLAQQMGDGLADAFMRRLELQLQGGEGPLARSISSTAERVSGSLVRGARGEVGWLPLGIAFALGLLLAGTVAWAISLSRSLGQLRRRAPPVER
ncbi:MAG: hypothetical protein HY901_17635 [Deltaproteobacteria bacterium]|nr:hypothetical protein [Deltaproteobacteria bacterium]